MQGIFLTSCKPVSFSRRTLHHGINIIFVIVAVVVVVVVVVVFSRILFLSRISTFVPK